MASLAVMQHNQTVLASLEPGDLIEFPRRYYSHWAVYVDDEKVVHLAGGENDGINGQFDSGHFLTISGQRFGKAQVKVDNFWDVVEDSKAAKNNRHDSKHRPLSKTEIVGNALARIGRVGYNALFDNCEHFANWCRYGLSKSEQADAFMGAAAIGTALLLTAGIVGIVSLFSPSKAKKEKQPLSKAVIVGNALARTGRVGYNVLFDNCEHFANWCRYGLSKSEQVVSFFLKAVVGAALLLTAGIVGIVSLFSPSKAKKEKQ